jgi:NAD-dependent deacetylase
MHRIEELIANCDLLLVIGTSAQVYPAAGLPELVKQQGGLIYEFNLEQSLAVPGSRRALPLSDFFFQGDLCDTIPLFAMAVRQQLND